METWNREELYADVWEQPLVKIARKHGVSAVMVGKVCRKLQIPLPGRGYWIKKEFGKPVVQLPLPEAKDLPVVTRQKQVPIEGAPIEHTSSPEPEPTDDYYKKIIEMESRTIPSHVYAKRHQFIAAAKKALSRGQADSRGILARHWDEPACLDIRVTKDSLDRALTFANAIVTTLEAAHFPITVQNGKHSTTTLIFGQTVPFAIVEKSKEIGRREVKEYGYTRTVIDYKGTGTLEFRAGDYACGRKFLDGKKGQLESLIAKCIGGLMREARDRVHQAERQKLWEIERREKERQRLELSDRIREEGKWVQDLAGWVDAWVRARQMREFIAELERIWKAENVDLSPDAPKGKRITWMKEQADRMDPTVPSPPSILDRKGELSGW
jgi:hypothetical protein